jgi:hypothetical protein
VLLIHGSGRDDPDAADNPDAADDPDPRLIDHVARGIAADFPDASPADVAGLLRDSLAATRDARVRRFRLIIAERAARDRLRRARATAS